MVKFGESTNDNNELSSIIEYLNKKGSATIKTWLKTLENKRLANRIMALDDDFIVSNIDTKVVWEIFKIGLPFAKTQIDWIKEHPRSTASILWYLEGFIGFF